MPTFLRRIGADTRYIAIAFPTAVVSFCLLVPFFAAGVATAPLVAGVFVLAVGLLIARGLATAERILLPSVLDREAPEPRYRPVPAEAGWFRRAVHPVTCGQSWMDLGFGLLRFPLAVAAFCIAVTWWAGTVAGLSYPLYGWILHGLQGESLPELVGLGSGLAADVALHTAAGVLFALTLPAVLRFAALTNASLAAAFLTAPASSPAAPYPPTASAPVPPAAPLGGQRTPSGSGV